MSGWVTAEEAAAHLGVSPAAVHVLAHRQRWRRRRRGRIVAYAAADVAGEVLRRAEPRRARPRLDSLVRFPT